MICRDSEGRHLLISTILHKNPDNECHSALYLYAATQMPSAVAGHPTMLDVVAEEQTFPAL
jgi:hypothetical protein